MTAQVSNSGPDDRVREPQRDLADYCQFWLEDIRRPCYAQAGFVLVRPSGQTLGFSCATHRDAWTERIRGAYSVLERAEWEARGRGAWQGIPGLDAGPVR